MIHTQLTKSAEQRNLYSWTIHTFLRIAILAACIDIPANGSQNFKIKWSTNSKARHDTDILFQLVELFDYNKSQPVCNYWNLPSKLSICLHGLQCLHFGLSCMYRYNGFVFTGTQ